MRILKLAVLVAVVAVAWAWHRGWLTVDPANVEHDATRELAAIEGSLVHHARKIEELAKHGELATPEQKAAIARQVNDFNKDHDALAGKLDQLKKATGKQADQLAGDVRASLDRSHAGLDRALESARPK